MKPRTKDELVDGILRFWDTVDERKCCRYINHLLPRVANKKCKVNLLVTED